MQEHPSLYTEAQSTSIYSGLAISRFHSAVPHIDPIEIIARNRSHFATTTPQEMQNMQDEIMALNRDVLAPLAQRDTPSRLIDNALGEVDELHDEYSQHGLILPGRFEFARAELGDKTMPEAKLLHEFGIHIGDEYEILQEQAERRACTIFERPSTLPRSLATYPLIEPMRQELQHARQVILPVNRRLTPEELQRLNAHVMTAVVFQMASANDFGTTLPRIVSENVDKSRQRFEGAFDRYPDARASYVAAKLERDEYPTVQARQKAERELLARVA